MVIPSQALDHIICSDFSHTIDFLNARKPRVPVETLHITHFSADNVNYRYNQRGVDAIIQMLLAIPENSLTHLECVCYRA